MRQDNRRVPTVMERLLLASVSLGLMMLASFVGSLYFTSGALPVKVALCTVLFVFLGMIIAVNVLFNKRR